MKIRVKKLSADAVIPSKAHVSDAGFDMTCTRFEVTDGGLFTYHTAIAVEIPEGHLRLLFPRSSIYKTGMILSNSLGTIDFGYRNEIMAVFYHVIPTLPPYKVGDRIAQIHFDVTEKIQFIHADQLSSTPRGLRGYGSTGK